MVKYAYPLFQLPIQSLLPPKTLILETLRKLLVSFFILL